MNICQCALSATSRVKKGRLCNITKGEDASSLLIITIFSHCRIYSIDLIFTFLFDIPHSSFHMTVHYSDPLCTVCGNLAHSLSIKLYSLLHCLFYVTY